MLRIELVGPPGVGKTTLLRVLADTLPDAMTARRLPLLSHFEAKGHRRFTEWLYGRHAGERWMRHRFEKAMVRWELKRLRYAPDPWPDLLASTISAFAESTEPPALVLERIQSFIRQVAAIRCAERLPGHGVVLFDEGIVQRAISLAEGNSDRVVEDYVNRMPLPSLTVVLTAPPELIQERLNARDGEGNRFHSMVERSLAVNDRISHAIGHRAGNVIEVSMDQPAERGVEVISCYWFSIGRQA